MNDLFSDDDNYEELCKKQDRDSVFGTLGVLILMAFIIIFGLLPSIPEKQAEKFAYQMEATIVSLDKGQDAYIAIVEGDHDGVIEHYTVDLTKQQFMRYKEQQPVTVEIKNNHCYIIE